MAAPNDLDAIQVRLQRAQRELHRAAHKIERGYQAQLRRAVAEQERLLATR
jgi:hypothetical protein